MTTSEARRRRYRAPSQVEGRFGGENQGISDGDRPRGAKIFQLNTNANSTRNKTPAFDGSYASPPPVSVPYGWRLREGRAGWSLVHDRHEWSVVSWLIQERRSTGRSYASMAEELERDRVPAPTGGRSIGRWHTERVRTLVLLYAPELASPSRITDEELCAEQLRELLERLENDPDSLNEAELQELHILQHDASERAGEPCPICCS